MVPTSSRELLDLLLEEAPLSLAELESFVAVTPREDLFLDYKDGKLLAEPRAAKQTLRRWVTGFANAEGGVLVVGFDETRPVRLPAPGPDRIGEEPLASWAAKAFAGMEGHFSPAPRFRTIPIAPGRQVLLIATARAPQLIPCREGTDLKYYLRFHDSTPEVPAYLVSDLLLGRRQHPRLTLELTRVVGKVDRWKGVLNEPLVINLLLDFQIENASLATTGDVGVGVVGWTLQERRSSISQHLLSYVDASVPPVWTQNPLTWSLAHTTARQQRQALGPLFPSDVGEVRSLGGVTVPPHPDATVRLAAYVHAAGSPPVWFQLEVETDGTPLNAEQSEFEARSASLTALGPGRRPGLGYQRP